jgi:hypothetical protein
MARELLTEGPHVPTGERELARLKTAIEFGELEDLGPIAHVPAVPRYLVTYMNSQTQNDSLRSATVVSVTNQSTRPNRVVVSFFKGFSDDTSPVGVASLSIPPQFTVDFGSRNLPPELCTVNAVPTTELTFDEGRAIVSSLLPEIGVSARVYYTAGDRDERLLALTDSKVVAYGRRNRGD